VSLPDPQRILVSGASPLGGKLALERAFSALRTRRSVPHSAIEIDADRTVEQFASTGLLLPVWRRKRGRWLSLAVVVETSPSMRFWQATATQFALVAERGLGALRVRHFFLRFDGSGGRGRPFVCDRRSSARKLDLPARDSLVIYLSDTLGPGWEDGQIATWLGGLVRHRPVVVVHLLPQHFWPRTPLANFMPLQSWRPQASAVNHVGRLDAPMIAHLDVDSIRTSIAALAGRSGMRSLCLGRLENDDDGNAAADVGERVDYERPDSDDAAPIEFSKDEIEELWTDFESSASARTKLLAMYLAAAPLVMPVMRMIERTLVPDAAPWQMAELMMSGLVRRYSACRMDDIESMEYEFLPDVRERLLQHAGEFRRREVIRVLTRYVEGRFGRSKEFEAYCAGREGVGRDGDASFAPFMRAAEAVYRAQEKMDREPAENPDEDVGSSSGGAFPTVADFDIEETRLRVGQELRSLPLDLPALLRLVVAELSSTATFGESELRLELDENIHGDSVGDPAMLGLIVTDLVQHALSYTYHGRVVVRANLERPAGPYDVYQDVRIAIEDSGGIDQQLLRQRLFGSQTTKRDGKGSVAETQIAVPISYCVAVVNMLLGTIGVSGEAGGAATIWLRFPVRNRPAEGTATDDEPIDVPPAIIGSGPAIPIFDEEQRAATCVLVVATDRTRIAAITRDFYAAGIDLILEESVAGFFWRMTSRFEQWSKERFDTVLVDLHAVSIDSLVAEIGAVTGGMGPARLGTRFLALGDFVDPFDAARLRACGFADVLSEKPGAWRLVDFVNRWTRPETKVEDDPRRNRSKLGFRPIIMTVTGNARMEAAVRKVLQMIDANLIFTREETDALGKLSETRCDFVIVDFSEHSPALKSLASAWNIVSNRRREACPMVIGIGPASLEDESDFTGAHEWIDSIADVHGLPSMLWSLLARRSPQLVSSEALSSYRPRVMYVVDRTMMPQLRESALAACGFDVSIVDFTRAKSRAVVGQFDLTLVDVDKSPRNVDVSSLRESLFEGKNYCVIVAVVDPRRAAVERAPERGFDQAISCDASVHELNLLRRWLPLEEDLQCPIDSAEAAELLLDELGSVAAEQGIAAAKRVRQLVRWDKAAMSNALLSRVASLLPELRKSIGSNADAAASLAHWIALLGNVVNWPEFVERAERLAAARADPRMRSALAELERFIALFQGTTSAR
jgi:hypothetical protein